VQINFKICIDKYKYIIYNKYIKTEKEILVMSSIERVYGRIENEFIRLQTFCNIANQFLTDGNNFDDYMTVENVYFDMGQNWKYTTLIYYEYNETMFKTMSSYQAFCPRDYRLIVTTDSVDKLREMAKYYIDLKLKKEWTYKNSLYEKFE
jgi:hypothetical protein